MTPCILHPGPINARTGYGQPVAFQGRRVSPHVRAYVEAKGPVPDGKQVHHRCRTRACIRGGHLRAVTPAQNIRQSALAKLTARHVRSIRRQIRDGEKQRTIAERFGVTEQTICDIKQGRSWRPE